ncbi:MAG: hypothetical protein ACYCT2_01025 [Thermoplasmataceae archaeon]
MASDIALSGKSDEIAEMLRKNFGKKTTLGTTGKSGLIAIAASFLCIDNSRYMNG